MLDWLIFLYQYVCDNFSNIASVIGIAITIIFAERAKKAADAARDASRDTKSKIYNIEASLVLHECISDAENIIRRADVDNWDAVSDIVSRVRRNLIMVKSSVAEESNVSALEGVLVQMRILSDTADNARHGHKKPPNKPKIVSTIRAQVDALSEIHRSVVSNINKRDVD